MYGFFTWGFLCAENCHLCRDFSNGDFLIWGELYGDFWRIIAGQFSLIFQYFEVLYFFVTQERPGIEEECQVLSQVRAKFIGTSLSSHKICGLFFPCFA
jgi:hypothetical protein